jgi:hypothetical protein
MLVAGTAPTQAFIRIWGTLIAPHIREAAHLFAAGPAAFAWPAPLQRLDSNFETILTALEKG